MSSALRAARLAAGLTQEELAEAVGCSQAVIARYESGAITVPPERVELLLDAIGLIGLSRYTVWASIVPKGYQGRTP